MFAIALVAAAYAAQANNSAQKRGLQRLLSHCVIELRERRYFNAQPQCYKRFPIREMTGIWMVGLESSMFVEHGHRHYTDEEANRVGAWLDTDTSPDPRIKRILASGEHASFQITIAGRRATMPGFFGHGGIARRGILLERLISIRRIG